MGPYGPQPGPGPNPDWAPTRARAFVFIMENSKVLLARSCQQRFTFIVVVAKRMNFKISQIDA